MQPPSSVCSNCGEATNPTALFCNHCGSSKATVVAGQNPNAGPTVALGQSTPAVLTPLNRGDFVGSNRRYRIEKLIGAGGFGETFEATDTQLDRSCVVKRMLVDPAWNTSQHQMMVANFEREAKLLATLNSPGHANIPDVYEYLPRDHCLVMKYIEGKNLNALGKIAQTTALHYIRDVCSALVYMHARKPEPALHRDIKPDNILLGDNGRVWLIDFGLAKSLPVASVRVGHGSLMAGTLGYTPPEQWQGNAEARSDVYALGATLHTLLTGYRPPFSQADIPDLVSGTKGGFPFIRTLDAKLDSRVETLIVQCMEFDVRKRPTAAQMLKRLEDISTTSQKVLDGKGKQLLLVFILLILLITSGNFLQNSLNSFALATSLPSPMAQPIPSISPSSTVEQIVVPIPVQPQKARITGARSLNIRAASNADARIVGSLADSDTFELTGAEQNSWYEVQFGDITGWVNGKFVERLP